MSHILFFGFFTRVLIWIVYEDCGFVFLSNSLGLHGYLNGDDTLQMINEAKMNKFTN
jgi:hypothetical protein